MKEFDRYSELVSAAQQGSQDAFAGLVRSFQDMALAYAMTQSPILADAVDAVQEAFIDAYRKLPLLRDPQAFPAWLRSIVSTQCGRIRRRERRADGLGWAEVASVTPETVAEERGEADRLLKQLEHLPDGERVVVAMHYLAGLSYQEIASFLGISEGAAKKRAHSGRERLRSTWKDTPTKMERKVRLPENPEFTAGTLLFAAIANEDVEWASRILAQNPELIAEEEEWESEAGRRLGLQPPRHATPLVRAAGRANSQLVRLLLEKGADPNRTCGCAGGETPLWTATVVGSSEIVQLLLGHGADPDQPAFEGATPLHVAAMRGNDETVRILLEAGADPALRDRTGRTPGDWAILNRHPSVADFLASTRTESRGDSGNGEWLESGIRAINLFSPLKRHTVVGWKGEPGSGSLVVLGELFHNLAWFEGLQVQWIGFQHDIISTSEVEHLFDELAPAVRAQIQLAGRNEGSERRRASFRSSVERLIRPPTDHLPPSLVVITPHPEHRAEVEASLPRLATHPSIQLIIYLASGDLPSSLPQDTTVTLDPDLADARIYPAIHPDSRSRSYPSQQHARIAEQARLLLNEGRSSGQSEAKHAEGAEGLRRYLTQPFHTTQPFTGKPGETTSLADTVEGVRSVLQRHLPLEL